MKNKKLKLARVERDLSQEDLANLVGVTRQTIGLIEAATTTPPCGYASPYAEPWGKHWTIYFGRKRNEQAENHRRAGGPPQSEGPERGLPGGAAVGGGLRHGQDLRV